MQYIYLPYILKDTPLILIATNTALSTILYTTSWFMVIIYIYLTIHRKYVGRINDDNGVLLSFIYSKYIIDILTNANMHVYQHEIARVVMWTFTTPIMLKMYTDVNQIKLTDINIHYHLIAMIPHIFVVPFKGQLIYLLSTIILSIPALFFMKTLFYNRQYPFTGIFICIWSVFMMINILDILHIISPIHAHSLYNISDTMCKFICAIVISSHNDQEDYRRRTLDIQTTQFIKYMINCVDKYITDNPNLTQICKKMVMYSKNKFNSCKLYFSGLNGKSIDVSIFNNILSISH